MPPLFPYPYLSQDRDGRRIVDLPQDFKGLVTRGSSAAFTGFGLKIPLGSHPTKGYSSRLFELVHSVICVNPLLSRSEADKDVLRILFEEELLKVLVRFKEGLRTLLATVKRVGAGGSISEKEAVLEAYEEFMHARFNVLEFDQCIVAFLPIHFGHVGRAAVLTLPSLYKHEDKQAISGVPMYSDSSSDSAHSDSSLRGGRGSDISNSTQYEDCEDAAAAAMLLDLASPACTPESQQRPKQEQDSEEELRRRLARTARSWASHFLTVGIRQEIVDRLEFFTLPRTPSKRIAIHCRTPDSPLSVFTKRGQALIVLQAIQNRPLNQPATFDLE